MLGTDCLVIYSPTTTTLSWFLHYALKERGVCVPRIGDVIDAVQEQQRIKSNACLSECQAGGNALSRTARGEEEPQEIGDLVIVTVHLMFIVAVEAGTSHLHILTYAMIEMSRSVRSKCGVKRRVSSLSI